MREIKFRVWDAHKRMWTEYKIHNGAVYFLDKSTGVWVGKYNRQEDELKVYTSRDLDEALAHCKEKIKEL